MHKPYGRVGGKAACILKMWQAYIKFCARHWESHFTRMRELQMGDAACTLGGVVRTQKDDLKTEAGSAREGGWSRVASRASLLSMSQSTIVRI